MPRNIPHDTDYGWLISPRASISMGERSDDPCETSCSYKFCSSFLFLFFFFFAAAAAAIVCYRFLAPQFRMFCQRNIHSDITLPSWKCGPERNMCAFLLCAAFYIRLAVNHMPAWVFWAMYKCAVGVYTRVHIFSTCENAKNKCCNVYKRNRCFITFFIDGNIQYTYIIIYISLYCRSDSTVRFTLRYIHMWDRWQAAARTPCRWCCE